MAVVMILICYVVYNLNKIMINKMWHAYQMLMPSPRRSKSFVINALIAINS